MRTALIDDPETRELPVLPLEIIDLSDPGRALWCGPPDPVAEWRSFEERYATLAFGLGVVPRRRVPDDPLWARPAGILLGLGALLAFLLLLSTA